VLVDVALPLPLEQTFTYRVPPALRRTAAVGRRAVVPFRGRSLTGVIVEEGGPADQFDGGFQLKDLSRLLDERPALPEGVLRLTRWMARYYVCSWGEALSAALPPGGKDLSPKRKRCLRLAERYRTPEAARALKDDVRGPKQKAALDALADFLENGQKAPVRAEVGRRAEASSSTLRSLVEKGLVEECEREVRRTPFDENSEPPAPPDHTLTPDQQDALDAVQEAVRADAHDTFLLHGVTGSGKTEVYIAALKETLHQGKSGIVLVPEIALTPQTVRRFRAHFPGEVAVLHSQMSRGERFDTWRSLREGRYNVAVGPRSAVLAPLVDVGLIVVDEEHETSYKQHDPAPRYHARDVAVMRASMAGAACVLGSATPSLESKHNADTGKYRLLELPERVPARENGRPAELPEVRILDLTRERKKPGFTGALSVPLQEALQQRLQRGEQTILLQNRRGFAPVVECTDCGFAPHCPNCAVTLTYHRSNRRLRCHYCGHTQPLPERCPSCVDGAGHLAQLGTGTQRVENELAEAFPDARIARMDRDTTSRKDAHARILRRFRTGEADILLGTQMIAKGLDFGDVTLVGVISADTGLLFPDFRAEEHTFQLLMQVAGRAGRADRAGEVLLQTRNPDHPALTCAARHDYEGFAQQTLDERRALGYPPFGRVVALEFRGPERTRALELAEAWTAALRRRAGDALDVMGPEPAAVSRIKGQHRFRTLLKAPPGRSPRATQRLLRAVSDARGRPPSGYHATIDVDAVGLL
jgi:primosomal protein N' (replication factor Y)